MKIMNKGRRAFIAKNEEVLDGGEPHSDKIHTYINPETTVEVSEKLGKFLATYSSEIVVIDKKTKKEK